MFSHLKKLAMFSALFASTQGYADTEDQSDFAFGVEPIFSMSGGIDCSANTNGKARKQNPVGGPGAGLVLYLRAFKFYIGCEGSFEYDAFRGLQIAHVEPIIIGDSVNGGLGIDIFDNKDYRSVGFRCYAAPIIGFGLTHNKSIWLGWHAIDQGRVFAKLPNNKKLKSIFNINAVKVAYQWMITPDFRIHMEYALGKLKSYQMKSEDPKTDLHINTSNEVMHVFKVTLGFPWEVYFH